MPRLRRWRLFSGLSGLTYRYGIAQSRATPLAVRRLGGELNFRGLGRRSLGRIASGLLGDALGIGKSA